MYIQFKNYNNITNGMGSGAGGHQHLKPVPTPKFNFEANSHLHPIKMGFSHTNQDGFKWIPTCVSYVIIPKRR